MPEPLGLGGEEGHEQIGGVGEAGAVVLDGISSVPGGFRQPAHAHAAGRCSSAASTAFLKRLISTCSICAASHEMAVSVGAAEHLTAGGFRARRRGG
jgi:hypothetical protein